MENGGKIKEENDFSELILDFDRDQIQLDRDLLKTKKSLYHV